MASLSERIARRAVPPEHLSAWWLGGSGFILKTPAGSQIWIDPYLSNIVEQIFNQPRAFPAPITVEDAEPDLVIATHLHEDHLDPGFLPLLARSRPKTQFLMPPTAMGRARTWGVPQASIATLNHGEVITRGDVQITAVPARHVAGPGFEAPDAMGVIVQCGAVSFYHTGDTEYDVRLRELRDRRITLATLCINGISGNMNAYEAALLAWHLNAKIFVPHHHLLWAREKPLPGETLDPGVFKSTYYLLGGRGKVISPEVGGEIEVFEDT